MSTSDPPSDPSTDPSPYSDIPPGVTFSAEQAAESEVTPSEEAPPPDMMVPVPKELPATEEVQVPMLAEPVPVPVDPPEASTLDLVMRHRLCRDELDRAKLDADRAEIALAERLIRDHRKPDSSQVRVIFGADIIRVTEFPRSSSPPIIEIESLPMIAGDFPC